MRLHILSDIHLEFGSFEPSGLIEARADVIILAGDIGLGERGIKWALETFKEKPVIYVLGNHEYYKHATPKLMQKLRELTSGTNVHVLEKGIVFSRQIEYGHRYPLEAMLKHVRR